MGTSSLAVSPRRAALAVAAAGALALLAPASSQAALSTFGSDLSAPASIEHAHQADTAYWVTALSGSAVAQVPHDGQIKAVRIKGMAIKRADSRPAGSVGGETMFHVQAIAGSTFRITSQALYLPNAGDPQQVNSFGLENFCVKEGERIAFNTVGGFDGVGDQVGAGNNPLSPYPMGTPLRIFGAASSATTHFYEQANGTDNGEAMASNGSGPREADQGGVTTGTLGGEELLMQMTIATGDDRSYECGGPNTYRPADPVKAPKPGGGGAPPGVQKTTIPKQRVNVSRKGVAGMALFCQPGAKACVGKVSIVVQRGAKTVVVGSKSYSIKAKSTGKLKVRLNKAGFRLFKQRKRKLPVTVTAVTGPGTPDFTSTFAVIMKKVGAK